MPRIRRAIENRYNNIRIYEKTGLCKMIKKGMKVRVKGNAKGTTWEFARVDEVRNGKAYIFYGSDKLFLGLMPEWRNIEELEVVEDETEKGDRHRNF